MTDPNPSVCPPRIHLTSHLYRHCDDWLGWAEARDRSIEVPGIYKVEEVARNVSGSEVLDESDGREGV